MSMRNAALSLALASLSLAARAQTPGPYVSAVGGGGFEQPSVRLGGSLGATSRATLGYAFANGVRAELEGDYADIQGPAKPFLGTFANVVYEFEGLAGIRPFLGLGLGYQELGAAEPRNGTGGFATQGILGADYPIGRVPGLALTAELRLVAVPGDAAGSPGESAPVEEAALLGFRYALGATHDPTPAPEGAAVPGPTGAGPRRYLVFFDWDRSDLSERGRQTVAAVAALANSGRRATIDVQGYEDTAGGKSYRSLLTRRRGEAVVAELVRDGLPGEVVTVSGVGPLPPSPVPAGKIRVAVVVH